MNSCRGRREALAMAIAALAFGTGACGSDDSATTPTGGGAQLDTIEPGVLKVAVQPYMPYTAVQGDKIVGLDGEILQSVADKLGLEVEPQVTDFAGMLGGVQSRRVDITIGGVAWSEDRQKQGLFTDPPYYSPPAMAVRDGKTYTTVDDLEGLQLGHRRGLRLGQVDPGRPRCRSCTPTPTPTASSTTSARAASTSASSTRC